MQTMINDIHDIPGIDGYIRPDLGHHCPRLCYAAKHTKEAVEMQTMINDIHDIPGIDGYIRPGTSSSSVAHGLDPSQIPGFNSVIWRYMDFAQLISLLDKEALFFCRGRQTGRSIRGCLVRSHQEGATHGQ